MEALSKDRASLYISRFLFSLEEALSPLFLKGIFMFFAPRESGQGLVEYALILAFVAVVVIAVMRLMGPKLGNTYSTISNSLP
jgi:pilus assembly protein Flp/PilA